MTAKSACQPGCNRFTWFGLLAVAPGLMILLAACGGGAGASTATTPTPVATMPTVTNTPTVVTPTPLPGFTQMVLIVDNSGGSFGFSRATLTIRAGTTVVWKNMSSVPHTITSDDGQTFDS